VNVKKHFSNVRVWRPEQVRIARAAERLCNVIRAHESGAQKARAQLAALRAGEQLNRD